MTNSSDKILRTDEDQLAASKIYDSYRDEVHKRQLSNTENYDKSILTLSSSGLAISLTFLKLIVPIEIAGNLWLIQASWFLFLVSIILSLIAYLVSNSALNLQLEIAHKYYIEAQASAFSKGNYFSKLNEWLNRIVGLSFALALGFTVIFVITNLNSEEAVQMSETEKATNSVTMQVNDSASVPTMQRVPSESLAINSAQVPRMQAAPSSEKPATSVPQAQSQQQPAKGE
ncbi:hypothetical protein [Endozoicomonas ascidiicola]|uniref:hypothetical protein n=1 Tax=Endozoicomonas ascidiicola TaxID=1698521 RepID=UPI00082ECD09|nr:hypothetical protein [Endozoicomonas ascidiicola]